ncbi:hypothetical protein [Neobacillus sp. LXY-1]|uniref:hypothetical protein n=1 Tax=Neobacillus sp. LXY-1 TaxID=3379133 RepID=UPI003EE1F5A9
MDTKILYYKIFEGDVKPIDYVNWANQMLINGFSTQSLYTLSSLRESLNIFEVEDYFKRAMNELKLMEPSQEECAKYYIRDLLLKIVADEKTVLIMLIGYMKLLESISLTKNY